MKFKFIHIAIFAFCAICISACYPDETLNVAQKPEPESDDPLDQFIQANFIDRYGVAVRYKYVDRFVDQSKRVTPPRREVVEPMLDFLTDLWIEPYTQVPHGRDFFENHVPAEVVLIGSPMFNNDGTETLGTADAGARITLTRVNDIDTTNLDWIFLQLGTIYHEFAHIVHQRYNLPPNFESISPDGYTSSGSWYNLTDEEALQRGFVSPYATSSFNEDFAEFVAHLLYMPEFYQRYIEDENCTTLDCAARNEGRALLRLKYNSVLNHYEQVTGVDLLLVREIIQNKLQN